jgi:hypothetical protein
MYASISQLSKIEFAVYSYDAGGAFYLAKLLNGLQEAPKIQWFLGGPAKQILTDEFISKISNTSNSETTQKKDFSNCKLILTTTGWNTDNEIEGIKKARQLKIECVTVLDHWSNYRRRLTRGEQLFLPDKLWVFDDFALAAARKEFRNLNVEIEKIADPVEKELKILSKKIPEQDILLYITEPISGIGKMNFSHTDYMISETESFTKFIESAKKIKKNLRIIVRVHPSEDIKFYKELLSKFDLNAEFSDIRNPLIDIARARYVVGLESIMLAWALILNKKTFTLLPLNGRNCVLPHSGIDNIGCLYDSN